MVDVSCRLKASSDLVSLWLKAFVIWGRIRVVFRLLIIPWHFP